MLIVQVPAAGQAQLPAGRDPVRACEAYPPESPQACSGQALDAFRKAQVPEVRPDPLPTNVPTALLPDARLGQAYTPQQLVAGGGSHRYGWRYEFGGLPAGMAIDERGFLRGTPQSLGLAEFRLAFWDQSRPQVVVHQTYALRVVGKGRPAPRRVPPPPPPPRPPPAPAPAVSPEPVHVDGQFTVYVLQAADLKALAAIKPPAAVPPPPPPPTPEEEAIEEPPTPAKSRSATSALPRALRPPTATTLAARAATAAGAPRAAVTAGTRLANIYRSATRANARGSAVASTTSAAGAPVVETAATDGAAPPADLAVRLTPMLDVEYPRRDLFERALVWRYPGLTSAQIAQVTDTAAKRRSFAGVGKLNWGPQSGCSCAPPRPAAGAKTVYGFFPYWRSDDPGPSINFSQVSRIGFFGIQLGDDGAWIRPTDVQHDQEGWWRQTSAIARRAHGHGARLDLVAERSDWRFLTRLTPDEQQARAEAAAHAAVALVDSPLLDRGVRHLLLPFWKDPTHVFDGLTIMFDYPTGAPAAEQAAFFHFQDRFVRQVIREMQRNGRAYSLNIVAPDLPTASAAAADARTGQVAYEASVWNAFLAYKKLAEPPGFHPAASEAEKAQYIGTTKIRMTLLAPLTEPTRGNKKDLRASIDQLSAIHGYDRVAVIQSVVPILFLPAGSGPVGKAKPKPAMMSAAESQQLDDDMVYFRQNFGGVGLWPAPMVGVGAGDEANQDIHRIFYKSDTGLAGLVGISICSLALRLVWQAFVLVTLIALAAYMIWGQVSGRAWIYRRLLAGLGAIAVVLGVVLLLVDPALASLRAGNIPLLVLLAILAAAAIWFFAKPRIPRP